MVIGGDGKVVGPNAIGCCGFLHPAVRCGELAGFVVEDVAGSPSVLRGVRLGGIVERSDFAPAMVSGELLDFLIESDWWRRGNPTIVAGELLGFGVECARRGFWWGWNPSVVASETLGIVVEGGWGWGWDWSPSIVAGDLLELVVERDPGKCGNKRQSCGVGGGVSEGEGIVWRDLGVGGWAVHGCRWRRSRLISHGRVEKNASEGGKVGAILMFAEIMSGKWRVCVMSGGWLGTGKCGFDRGRLVQGRK